jgi:hypothetical protein
MILDVSIYTRKTKKKDPKEEEIHHLITSMKLIWIHGFQLGGLRAINSLYVFATYAGMYNSERRKVHDENIT